MIMRVAQNLFVQILIGPHMLFIETLASASGLKGKPKELFLGCSHCLIQQRLKGTTEHGYKTQGFSVWLPMEFSR